MDPLDNNFSDRFELNAEIKSYLAEAARWAKFIAIVGFVGVGLMVIGALGASFFIGAMAPELQNSGMPFPTFLFSVIYLILAAVAFFPILYLYRFSEKMQMAIRSGDNQTLTNAFYYLKAHYKYYGIMIAVILGFYAIGIIFALIGGIGMF